MFTVKGLDHLVLRTDQVTEMLAFYRDALGCHLEREVADLGLYQIRVGVTLVDLVDVQGELGRVGGPSPGKGGRNLDHFCVQIEPFDENLIREHLAALGIAADKTSRRYGAQGFGPSIYIEDPDGNTVELKGPPELSA